jgi:hypothetical protein
MSPPLLSHISVGHHFCLDNMIDQLLSVAPYGLSLTQTCRCGDVLLVPQPNRAITIIIFLKGAKALPHSLIKDFKIVTKPRQTQDIKELLSQPNCF